MKKQFTCFVNASLAKTFRTEYFHEVNVLKLERALVLVDPMGLIAMGAPFDEYSSEAEAVLRILGEVFSPEDLVDAITSVLNASFNGSFDKAHPDERKNLTDFYFEDINPAMRFHWGDTYKVIERQGVFPTLDLHGRKIRSGDIVTCLNREDFLTSARVALMVDGEIQHHELSTVEEARMRWFFDEVE
jgi:hypothetical protein